MSTTDVVVVSLILSVPVLSTLYAIARARQNRVETAEAVLETPRSEKVFMATCAVMMLFMVTAAMVMHPPKNVGGCLSYLGILVPTAAGLAVVCNKRLALVGQRLIDVTMTGRRSEVTLAQPWRFHRVPLGWQLRTGTDAVFIPGYWLMGDGNSVRREIDAFKELMIARSSIDPTD